MAKRISELPAAGAVADTDELELNQSGTSRKATRAQVVAGLAAATHVHTLADVTDAGALAAKDTVAQADIEDAAVTTAKLADVSVSSGKLALAAVSTDQLADDAVTTAKIAANAITAAEIATNAVGTGQLQDIAVTTAKIAANAVGSGQLANDAVTAAKIADGTVTAAEIAANAITATQLAGSAVTTSKIANAAVTMAKVASSAIDSGQLVNNAVISSKIAGNAVTPGKIAANAVGSSQLADGAVTTAKIASGAVDGTKIAAKVVGPGQLADTAVIPGAYTVASVTVDQQGRITGASSGTAGEINTGTNVGMDGVGVFAGKLGVDLQFRHIAPASDKIAVTLNGEDIALDVVEGNLQIPAGNVSGLGALATKDLVAETDIAENAVTTAHLMDGAVTADKIAAQAIGPAQLADTGVTPGTYTVASITVDQQGRITAASSGTGAGEINTGSNIGSDGVGVFAGKLGVDLQFRHIAPASAKVSVTPNGGDIDLDVVEGNLQVPAGNVTGLAAVATSGTLAALSSLDANGGALTNFVAAQDTVTGAHTFVQSDTGREKIFAGVSPANWTIPALNPGTHAVVHNIGTAPITFAASGVTLKGLTTLAVDQTAAVSWLPGNVVKLTGELS